MIRAALIATIITTATACSPTMKAENPRGGLIRIGGGIHKEADALELADEHCRRAGRVARITSQDLLYIAFDCVEP